MASIRILVGSVYGGALLTARTLKKTLEQEGHRITVLEEPTLEEVSENDEPVLICTSTTGQGELPPNLLPFYLQLREQLPQQPGRAFGVIVLGDSSYGDTFCGAGGLMEEAFYETSARKVGETLRIDALETAEPELEAIPWVREWLEAL
ncbi:flavodoxin [Marinobacter sp. 71-i]|uniref:Flavodoxin n=1 Tax=Marinobacter iranensis TaxID=2962607 RepID=A0ABT5Y6J3_9GAMM|nr:flavodoxin [Marinobacter iranensis]MDF0749300.1 flavodoxin [Marinobacter iranensis]